MSPRWQTAFITGGSTGIGASMARQLISEGTKVAVCGRRMEPLETLQKELGENLVIIQADVSDPYRARAVVDEAKEELGGLELVIANAGFGRSRHATQLTIDDIVDVLNVNVQGACATVTAAIPHMLAQGKGNIAGISSLAANRGLPTTASYSAAKAALSVFLESLRVDLHHTPIGITDVRPGFVDTPLTKKNKFKMPFLMDSDRAAGKILAAIERKRSVFSFPWPMALLTWLSRWIPNFVFDRLMSRPPKG